jgi:hypothetical protein
MKRFSTELLHLRGAAVARILIGIAGVHVYYANYAHRRFLYGPHNYVHGTGFLRTWPSLYSLAGSNGVFELVYHVGFLAAIVFAVFGGRIPALVHAAFFWSLYSANPDLFDGGDSFGRIASIFMVVAVTNAYFAPGAAVRREKLLADRRESWRTAAHNTVVVLLVAQLVFVYLTAGLWKVAGPRWREGTILYYIAQLEDYRFAPWIDGLYRQPLIVNLATYSVVLLELGFVVALRSRLRPVAVAAMAVMHAGIAVSMGLVGFMINMWGGLALCLSDADYERIAARADWARAHLRWGRQGRQAAGPVALATRE